LIKISIGHQNDKFLAAEPGHDVGQSRAPTQQFAERRENLVPASMPIDVIDALEVIEGRP